MGAVATITHCAILSTLRLWWANLDWMPGAHQGALSLPLLSWTEERK